MSGELDVWMLREKQWVETEVTKSPLQINLMTSPGSTVVGGSVPLSKAHHSNRTTIKETLTNENTQWNVPLSNAHHSNTVSGVHACVYAVRALGRHMGQKRATWRYSLCRLVACTSPKVCEWHSMACCIWVRFFSRAACQFYSIEHLTVTDLWATLFQPYGCGTFQGRKFEGSAFLGACKAHKLHKYFFVYNFLNCF